MQRHFEQEILRISLFIYYKNLHFAQDISWKMSKNFSLGYYLRPWVGRIDPFAPLLRRINHQHTTLNQFELNN